MIKLEKMGDLFNKIYGLMKAGEVLISEHGYDELAEDNLSIREIIEGVANGAIVQEYSQYHKIEPRIINRSPFRYLPQASPEKGRIESRILKGMVAGKIAR